MGIFSTTAKGLSFLIKGVVLSKKTGARFASGSETGDFLNRSNTGLLLDGVDKRLSDKNSFQNVAVVARVGAGKTSRYIIPNVIDKAKSICSLVVNDPKGEVYQATSGYMARNGFNVLVLNPEDLNNSNRFNPLAEAKTNIELEQIAEILVKCGNPSEKSGEFWNQGAIRFVSLFLKALNNIGRFQPEYLNLANLLFLFQNFGDDGRALDDFMLKATINPDDPQDQSMFAEWRGLLTGNEEGIRSFVLNAITALKALSNPSVRYLTAQSDFDLSSIRERKTIIYLITPPQHAEYYSFLTSIFFRSVFNVCMRKMPDEHTLPVYILYDEFGHSTIPNFVSVANTIRGYKVSLSIILQSMAQLNARYGRDYAQSIQGGFSTYMTYSGADIETAKFFESIIGRVRERKKNDYEQITDAYKEYNLLNSNEIRTLKDDESLIVSSNKHPIILKSKAYFEQSRFKNITSYPAHISSYTGQDKITLVRL